MYMAQEKEFTITNRLGECRDYADNIIDSVCEILVKRDLKYITNDKKNEITISEKNINKDDIMKLIYEEINIPKHIVDLLINIYQLKNQVIIRQKRR